MSVGRVLVYGGKGALGSVVVNFFKSQNFVSSFDVFQLSKLVKKFLLIHYCETYSILFELLFVYYL